MIVLQSMVVEFMHLILQWERKTMFVHQRYSFLTLAYQILIQKELQENVVERHGKQEH